MQNENKYDLETRTFKFAKDVRAFLKVVPRKYCTDEDARQLLRSSGSVGANYIEANESLSKKDFVLRVKICRKEAKETRYWLKLIDLESCRTISDFQDIYRTWLDLLRESDELLRIFSAIVLKFE